MARRWMGVAFLTGWLGVSASAHAQYLPAGAGPGPAPVPGPAQGELPPLPDGGQGMMPGPGAYPMPGGPLPGPYPVAPFGPPGVTECLPPNGFSAPPEAGEQPHHFYFGVEYLTWWSKKRLLPSIVNRGQFTDTVPGAAFQPTTQPVLGGRSADTSDTPGVRGVLAYWFDDCHTCGIDGSAFVMEESTKALRAASLGLPTDMALTRPFFNPNTGRPDADPLALPNIQAGGLVVRLPRRFYGGDLNFRYSTDEGPLSRVKWSFIGGVRYAALDEKVLIDAVTADLVGDGDPGIHTIIQDAFTTYNRFYGGQIGLESDLRLGPVFLTWTAKFAAGETTQTAIVKGDTIVLELQSRRTTVDPTKGFLAQPSNVGRYRRHAFSYLPEATVRLGVDFNSYVSAWVGYNAMWWTDVLRPGDQIDTTINLQAVGAGAPFTGTVARPIVPLRHTDFWAQGISFGFLVSF